MKRLFGKLLRKLMILLASAWVFITLYVFSLFLLSFPFCMLLAIIRFVTRSFPDLVEQYFIHVYFLLALPYAVVKYIKIMLKSSKKYQMKIFRKKFPALAEWLYAKNAKKNPDNIDEIMEELSNKEAFEQAEKAMSLKTIK